MNIDQDINPLIPQRFPFVMTDRLVWQDKNISRTIFLVRKDNIFVEDGRLAEPGLVENIAQTAAARAGYEASIDRTPVKVGYIGAIKNLEVFGLPSVGDELLTEITLLHRIFDASIVKGTVHCNGILLAACEMKIFISQSK